MASLFKNKVEFIPGWEDTARHALLPQVHELSDDINRHIQIEAPRDTSALADASYAEVDESEASISVGVESDVINPRTQKPVGDYARYVIEGTSRQPANDYLERATAAAIQNLRRS